MVTAANPAPIPREEVDVVIVGGGPAGLSTALHLVQQDESFKHRMVVLERACHPREKLCAGGVSGHALEILRALECDLDIPVINVDQAVFRFDDKSFALGGDPAFTVTRRSDFDAWLYRTAIGRGIRVEQNQCVTEIDIRSDRVEVITKDARYVCRVLVGADGTTSRVRRLAGFAPKGSQARLLEIRTSENPADVPEFRERIAAFDFTSLGDGLQGYYWDFPSLVDGEHQMNRGVFESRISRSAVRADLMETLRMKLAQRSRNLDEVHVQGFGINHFHWASRISRPNVLLVGDAAGADPLLGEGIRCALGYGAVAAAAIVKGFESEEFSFRTYRRSVLASATGRMMLARTLIAALLYRSWNPRVVASVTGALGRLQRTAPSRVAVRGS